MTVTLALLQEFVMKEHEKSNDTTRLSGGKSWHLKKSNDTTIILSGGKRERATRLGGRAADPGFSTNQIAQVRFYLWSTFFFCNFTHPFHHPVLITLEVWSCKDIVIANTNEHWSMVTGCHSKWTTHWSSLELLPFQPLLVKISCNIQNLIFAF